MTKLNKTQRRILDSHNQGTVIVPLTWKLGVKQASKLVYMGILTQVDSTTYRVETTDDLEIYELLVIYRAKMTRKMARQHQGRYHFYSGYTHYVLQYNHDTKRWACASINGLVGEFKTRKQALEAVNAS